MEDLEFPEDDILGQIDWDHLFDDVVEYGFNALESENLTVVADSSPAEALSNPSPVSGSSWIGEIENLLMTDDDDDKLGLEPSQEMCDSFLADLIVDSPGGGSGEVLDVSTYKDSNVCDDADFGSEKEKEKVDGQEVNNDAEGGDDPDAKKRRRQLRNRDAAVRSRERKKMYVRDVELKSKYLEGECRRLGRLLQCCYAENQALRLSLQKGNAFGAPMTKQESAVLLLESLLLGSLLWFLGIMCLLPLPPLLSTVEAVWLENVGKKPAESLVPSGAGSKMFGSFVLPTFIKSRRCKSSRTRMKLSSLDLLVLV